jgi:hypothetical protein
MGDVAVSNRVIARDSFGRSSPRAMLAGRR